MSIQDTQAQLFGGPSGNNVEIETSGRVIRPFVSMIDAVVGEAKVDFDADGVSVRAVNAPNVGMVDIQAYPEAFEQYDLGDESFTTGFGLNAVASQLKNARMGKSTDDPVSLDIDGTRTLVTTSREYEITTLTQTNEVLNIDPDSIRERPDVPSVDLACEATVDVSALEDALDSVNRVSDHVVIRDADGTLVIAGEGGDDHTGEYGTAADFGEIVDVRDEDAFEPGVESKYSLDFLQDMASGLSDGKIDEVTLVWGDGFPIRLEFERTEDGTTLYDGVYFLAPRIPV